MLQLVTNPFNWEVEEYEPPVRTGYIHTMMCECNAKRCYGYTSPKWKQELEEDV